MTFKAGDMVALKRHHQFPMVVLRTYVSGEGGLPVPGGSTTPNRVRVTWLDKCGVPHEAGYPFDVLEAIDG